MWKRVVTYTLMIGLALVFAPAASGQRAEPAGATSAGAETPEMQAAPIDLAVSQIRTLDLRVRVAQLMLVTLQGKAAPSSEDRLLLEHYTPGGVVIPEIGPDDAPKYVQALRAYEAKGKIPLWIGANMFTIWRREAQLARRFKEIKPPLQLPSLLSLAALNDPEATKFVAEVVGEFLGAMGFNLHLGPYLELPPSLPGARGNIQSLGSDLDFIGQTADTFRDVLREDGIAAMMMGFPGGGNNRVGKSAPVLLTPAPRLAEQDLRPFREAIEHGAQIVHVGNVLVPTIDPSSPPACLSPAVMRHLLRETLGFKGVVVAGPIDATHVGELYDFSEAAIRALAAGADMLLWNGPGRRVIRAVDNIQQAVKAGRLDEAAIDASLLRVLALKQRYSLRAREAPEEKKAERLGKKRSYKDELGGLERRSITLVQNRGGTLPLTKEKNLPLGITGVFGVDELADQLKKPLRSIRLQPIVSARHLGRIEDFELDRVTSRLSIMDTVICILTGSVQSASKAKLVHALKQEGVRVVAVHLGYPDALPDLADADAIVLAYCHSSAYEKTVEALADVLLGRGPVAVGRPERDVRMKVGETGVFDARDVVRCPAGRLPVSLGEPYVAGLAFSYNPTNAIKKLLWDFGDGKRKKGLRVEHAYAQPGRYPVVVTVTGKTGEVASRTFHVIIE